MSEPSTSLPLELEAGAPAPPSAPAPVEPPTPVTPSEPETYPPSADDKGKGKATEDLLERFTCHIWCVRILPPPSSSRAPQFALGTRLTVMTSPSCCDSLEVPSEPVVTPCGHLHCWPCMHEVRVLMTFCSGTPAHRGLRTQWLVESSGRACPVCKAPLTVEKLVPIYAGSGEETDPRCAWSATPSPPSPCASPTLASDPLSRSLPEGLAFSDPPASRHRSSRPIPPRPRPASSAAATSYRSGGTGSAFSLQAGLFPLPGLSFGWTWPPPPAGDAGPAPHLAQDGGAPFLVAQPATLVRRADVDWRTALMQQVFMILFFAVFVAITLAG